MVARASARVAVLICLTLAASLTVHPAGAASSSFSTGDVFVGVGSNNVQWRLPDGTLNKTLTTGSSSSITTGMAFDDAGKLYVTGYTSNVINRFDTSGAANGTFGGGFNSHPESITFDRAGNAYVGQERGSRAIVKLNAAGTRLASYSAATDANHGTDRIDLATDQCTVYYTGEAKTIRRFDTCTNSQGPSLTTTLPGTAAEDVKLIPGGGVLVADTQAVHRLTDAGAIVQTYDVANRNCWVALALDPTASSFWAGDRCASQVYRFDLGTGDIISTFKTNTKSGSINGLAVAGGATAARYIPPPSADLSASITGANSTTGNEQYTYTAGAANGGPDAATDVRLSVNIDRGEVLGATGAGWSCATASQSASCSRALSLDAGDAAASVTVTVRTPQGTAETITMTGTATVSANEDDPNSGNNTATKVTSVGPYASGNIPPSGGVVSTATTACPTSADPACGSVTFPAGPGGFASIAELIRIGSCSLSNCIGPSFEVVPPDGYVDPEDPIEIELRYDVSLVPGTGTNFSVWVEKPVGGVPVTTVVPPCQPLGHAVPAPCVNGITRDGLGDLHVVLLALSGDPKFQLFN